MKKMLVCIALCASAPLVAQEKSVEAELSEICTQDYYPVCGDNGKTYRNLCHAQVAGFSWDTLEGGACAGFSILCPETVEPVCGIDGKTYGNSCHAQAHGVQSYTDGECVDRVDGELMVMQTCKYERPPKVRGEYCSATRLSCTGEGLSWTYYCPLKEDSSECPAPKDCVKTGGIVTGCREISDPVCGFNGKTYGNDCEAEVWGFRIRHDGECSNSETP